jgi:hypothetical protein
MTEPPKPTGKNPAEPTRHRGARTRACRVDTHVDTSSAYAPKASKRAKLERWLNQNPKQEIGEPEYAALREALAPISESYLRKLLRDSGVPLAPLVAGVRQSNLDELEASLLALLDEYEGDPSRHTAIRKLIITAKDHARWATKRTRKASNQETSNKPEMILWMITWLENPPVFRQWVRLRRQNPQSSP